MNSEFNIDSLSDASDVSDISDTILLEIDSELIYKKQNLENKLNNIIDITNEIGEELCDDLGDELCDDLGDDLELQNKSNSYLFYNQDQEIQDEISSFNYHLQKNSGDWLLAKHIVSYSKDKLNTEFFWDYLDLMFKETDDNFDNINKIIYSSNESLFEFDTNISKYIVDNLKICKYIPSGYLFNNSNDTNMWSFKIVVITNKNIYAANRYIDENKLGCY